MYVVRRDRLNLIPEETRCDMTDFIETLKRAGGRIGVFPIGENALVIRENGPNTARPSIASAS